MVTYAPHTQTEAIARARGWVGRSYPVGWCQKWVVAEIFGTGAVGDWDGDGAADAEDGWKKAVRNGKVVTAANIPDINAIPAGLSCYWTGGRGDYGHAAVTAGGGFIYSTDLPTSGKVGKVPLTAPRTQWGLTFLGYVLVEGNGYTLTDPPAVSVGPTVFDICAWNIARPRWYTPWAGRAAEVARELNDEASVYCFQELFESGPIATVKAALPECDQFSGPAGLEFFYDRTKWVRVAAANHYSGIANRWAQEVTLKRVQTGRVVTFFNVHAPIKAEGDTAKARYGAWLAGKVKMVTNPVVIAGDLNTSSDAYSPKKELRAIGYIGYKEQAAIVNESTGEAIPSGKDYCDIRTNPAGPADITGGQVDLSTNSLESDHRRIEARVSVAPKVEPAPAPVPIDLTNWKLTLPTPLGGESPTEIKQPALATYENPPYFDRRPDGLGFRAPVDGAHTPNSSYPRSELRELRPGGDWSTSSGAHEMVIEQAITAVPGEKPHVVAGQIHDASDDVIMVRLEGERLFVESDGDEVALLTDSYQLGTRFRVSIRTDATGIYVYYNGVGGRVLTGTWSACYFKAGCYTQANESNGTGYGEVVVYSLDVTHT